MAREILCNIYLDWINNYASFDTFANNNGITIEQADDLLRIARSVFLSDHPEA